MTYHKTFLTHKSGRIFVNFDVRTRPYIDRTEIEHEYERVDSAKSLQL